MANEESKLDTGGLQVPDLLQRVARQIYALRAPRHPLERACADRAVRHLGRDRRRRRRGDARAVPAAASLSISPSRATIFSAPASASIASASCSCRRSADCCWAASRSSCAAIATPISSTPSKPTRSMAGACRCGTAFGLPAPRVSVECGRRVAGHGGRLHAVGLGHFLDRRRLSASPARRHAHLRHGGRGRRHRRRVQCAAGRHLLRL